MTKQPWKSNKKFSSTASVGRSRSFVGSSRIRKFGLRKRIDKRKSLLFSPPLKEDIYVYCLSGGNKNRFRNWAALKELPSARGKCSAIFFTNSMTRISSLICSPVCE